MHISISYIFFIGIGYLLLLFAIAYAAEKNWIKKQILNHPIVYILSIGVCVGGWGQFEAANAMHQYGYGAFIYYIGISLGFILGPILLAPILRIIHTFKLTSLADIFSFRYRNPWVGVLTTLTLLIASIFICIMQIKTITNSINTISGNSSDTITAILFCSIILGFTILFGARERSLREKHPGLVLAVAFEAMIKLTLLMILGVVSVYLAFDNSSDLFSWIQENQTEKPTRPVNIGHGFAGLSMFFFSTIFAPYIFHMVFSENRNKKYLTTASWSIPIYLLLLAIPVPFIYWSATKLGLNAEDGYFVLLVGLQKNAPELSIIGFIGGLSATSGLIIVTTLAMSNMIVNHLALPIIKPQKSANMSSWLVWLKRSIIFIYMIVTYICYLFFQSNNLTTSLAFFAFSLTIQLLPGLIGILYWAKATSKGFIASISISVFLFFFCFCLQHFTNFNEINLYNFSIPLDLADNNVSIVLLIITSLNAIIFVITSLLTRPNPAETKAAQSCTNHNLYNNKIFLTAKSVSEIENKLIPPLGTKLAEKTVYEAIKSLNYSMDENRPHALSRLRDSIETQLSDTIGTSAAQEVVDSYLTYEKINKSITNSTITIENHLGHFHKRLKGLAAELDQLRLFHRQTLEDLPMGACLLNNRKEIVMWNHAMEQITKISNQSVVGRHLNQIPEPWSCFIDDFITNKSLHAYKKNIHIHGNQAWFNLHKAAITDKQKKDEIKNNDASNIPYANDTEAIVILVEDLTERQLLENKLAHNERLASIGHLAAGVAHEIGNPITNIACIAQNTQWETKDTEIKKATEQILEQTHRITRILQSLVSFSHAGQLNQEFEPIPIYDSVTEAIQLLSLRTKRKLITFTNNCGKSDIICGDPQRILQVLVNILSNAIDACDSNQAINITSYNKEDMITIEIIDTGNGIDPSNLDQIFDPFFTTKPPGQGTGLGLALVHNIIEEHYGQVAVISPNDTVNNKGTTVKITLPRCDKKLSCHDNLKNNSFA